MSTQPSAQLTHVITQTLDRLNLARQCNPNHKPPSGVPSDWHINCDVCLAEKQLNRLIDKIPRKQEMKWPTAS